LSKKDLNLFLLKGIDGRKVTRTKDDMYKLEEPTLNIINKIYSLKHKILIKEDSIVIKSYSPFSIIISTLFSLHIATSFIIKGITKNNWEFEHLIVILIIWVFIPAIFFFLYLLLIPILKRYKVVIMNIKH
jgi:hypothetical protein